MSRRVLAGLMILVCILAGVGVFLFFQQKKESEQLPSAVVSEEETAASDTVTYHGQTYVYNSDLTNVLFLGVDKEADSVAGETVGRNGQADCILLLIMNRATRETKLLQISRDSMTDIDIYGITGSYLTTERHQLALQYAFGESDARSCWLMKEAVSKLLYSVPIRSTMALSVDGIGKITEAMGGVTLTVPEDYTSVDPSFVQGVTLNLQGELAEKYVRYRDVTVTGSNNDRIERQNQFLQALFRQLQMVDADTFQQILDTADPYLTTDLSVEELQNLREYTMSEEIAEVPGAVAPGPEHEEFTVDEQRLYELVLELFYVPENQ